jgi:hypothetical protein
MTCGKCWTKTPSISERFMILFAGLCIYLQQKAKDKNPTSSKIDRSELDILAQQVPTVQDA